MIEPAWEVDWFESGGQILHRIESAGRTAYKSEDKITPDSSKRFVRAILRLGHLSVIEHVAVTARITCDRGISHELVRHRLASYTQESTRYCNYSKAKFKNELTFIMPRFLIGESSYAKEIWFQTLADIEKAYLDLLKAGKRPEEARSVLPNSLKTEIVMTANLREWLHFFNLRTSKKAHPDMRYIAQGLLKDFQDHIPLIFDGVGENYETSKSTGPV